MLSSLRRRDLSRAECVSASGGADLPLSWFTVEPDCVVVTSIAAGVCERLPVWRTSISALAVMSHVHPTKSPRTAGTYGSARWLFALQVNTPPRRSCDTFEGCLRGSRWPIRAPFTAAVDLATLSQRHTRGRASTRFPGHFSLLDPHSHYPYTRTGGRSVESSE